MPISHESGVNLKSACDLTPISFELEPPKDQKSTNEMLNFNTYRKFWSIQKFLQNPLGIFIDEEPENESNAILFKEDDNSMEIEEISKEETSKIKKPEEKDAGNNKNIRFNRFFENVFNILEIFNANPILINENQKNLLKKFPRFLTNSSLIETQVFSL